MGLIALKHRAGFGAALAFLALTAMSTSLWWSASEQAKLSAGERFAFRVSEVRFALAQRLLAYEQVLRGGVGLFAASDAVTREDWSAYVWALWIEQNYPGVQGIGFARRVVPAGLEAHIVHLSMVT